MTAAVSYAGEQVAWPLVAAVCIVVAIADVTALRDRLAPHTNARNLI